ncbi:MAG TPA: nucleoside triphosphate pyrophosphohydrolase family protein [Gemmataceae bacterium]|nr:nucleoside triphosphate pyrophosphohydrolase family protein [Gemmataceae bacterium]
METTLTFRDYQKQAIITNRVQGEDLPSIIVPLLGLAGEAGSLLSEYKKWMREGDRYRPFTDQVAEEIGDILWYLANIAEKEGLDLQEIAEENLAKIADRFHSEQTDSTPLFGGDRYDTTYPESERLPLSVTVEFREIEVDGRRKLETRINGVRFGDSLTDNSHVDDGYRFHDVFHFTNAILLGWSPIVRRTLGVKRKSVPQVDEVEDGARAGVTEEAISAVVFGYAKDFSFFQGSDTVEFGLLRMIKQMTAPFEVRDKGLRQWEIAILEGYKVWRELVANKGGVFIGDAKSRFVRYEPLPGKK